MRTLDSIRKAENRTKIQLGGLVLKSGLAHFLGIEPGYDLQLDENHKPKATLLLGALIKAVYDVKLDPSNKIYWKNLALRARADDLKRKVSLKTHGT